MTIFEVTIQLLVSFQDGCECVIFYADQMCERICGMCDADIVSDKEIQMVSIMKTVSKFAVLCSNTIYV
jgi:hypothetical protein